MSVLKRILMRSVAVLVVLGFVYLAVSHYCGAQQPDASDGRYDKIPRTLVESSLPTESSPPPSTLYGLREKHREAWRQLRRAEGEEFLASVIGNGLRDPAVPVAIVRVEESVPRESRVSLRLRVEKVLRGSLPETVSAECYGKCEPVQASLHLELEQHFRPVAGQRILASLRGTNVFYGILNLNDPAESSWLPQAVAIVSLDERAAREGPRVYEEALRSPLRAVRETAMERLLDDEMSGSGNGERILTLIQRLLERQDPNDRWDGINWLTRIGSFVRDCQRPRSPLHNKPPFQLKSVRALLAIAEKDSNVVVGDKAFEALAALDFFRKENAGRCAAIHPELRRMVYCTKGAGRTDNSNCSTASCCGSGSNCSVFIVYQEEFREPDRPPGNNR